MAEIENKKLIVGLYAILFGWLGIHKFILGYKNAGIIMVCASLIGGAVTCGIATTIIWVIALIEGIIYIVKSPDEFKKAYIDNQRGWF